MSVIRKTIRRAALAAAGLIVLVLAAYLLLLAVNLNDAAPSELTKEFRASVETRPVPSDAENAFLMILGFSALPDDDPLARGIARRDWMLAQDWEPETIDDPLLMDFEPASDRPEAITALSQECGDISLTCIAALDSSTLTALQWRKSEDWLLRRYIQLLSMPKFLELNSFDVRAPLPSYHVVLEGQKLFFLDSLLSVRAGDADAVRRFLATDLAFWRSVLRQSDLLITKMIATVAVARHFKFGNLLLRELASEVEPIALPAVWLEPISLDERSMRRCFVGEWLFSESMLDDYVDSPIYPLSEHFYAGEQSAWDSLLWATIKPLWQPQDSNNRYADLLNDLGAAFDVSLDEVPGAMDEAATMAEAAFVPRSRLYNITGDYLLAGSGTTMHHYAARVADLEGVRRASLVLADLRSAGIDIRDAADFVSSSTIVDPYTAHPFEWDRERNEIVFEGLENLERGTHRLPF